MTASSCGCLRKNTKQKVHATITPHQKKKATKGLPQRFFYSTHPQQKKKKKKLIETKAQSDLPHDWVELEQTSLLNSFKMSTSSDFNECTVKNKRVPEFFSGTNSLETVNRVVTIGLHLKHQTAYGNNNTDERRNQ